jgi:alpha-mannosidase II
MPIKTYLNQCEWFEEQSEMNTDIQANDLISKISFDDVDGGVWKQGYDIKYNEKEWTSEKKLTVFVIPHSHNDPGWLLTFEQYFMQRTRSILDTIVNVLTDKATRKFIWAETSYLSLWWSQADDIMKSKMKRLIVETKQLEIVTGGWVMNDEVGFLLYFID